MITAMCSLLAEAVFCSALQPSDQPTPDEIDAAVVAALDELSAEGCAAVVAQEFGDHPETACPRMVWALDTVAAAHTVSPG